MNTFINLLYNNIDRTIYSINNSISLFDIPIMLFSCLYLTTLGTIGYNLFKNNFVRNKKQLIIIRGVPGSGKKNLVYHLENNINDKKEFTIISSQYYYYSNNKYIFDRKNINESYSYSFKNYIDALVDKIHRIYIINNNNKSWMYENYIKLAKEYNYDIKIVEIMCPDKQHLYYFNTRSKHNPPMSYSKHIFSDWDEDLNAQKYEAFLGTNKARLPGDSLPSYPPITSDDLDNELDIYNNQKIIDKNYDDNNFNNNLDNDYNHVDKKNRLQL